MRRRHFLSTTIAATAVGFKPLGASAKVRRAATGYIRTNWSRDPYSFGSYSFIAKGASKKHHTILGRPIGERLFFAGEATHPSYNSTVHAAFETGIMAYKAVIKTNASKVAVVGAGVSGLTAGMQLAEDGYDVTVFEARDRIGGRIWTDRRLGVPLDLGASWIHGDQGNPLVELTELNRIDTVPTEDTYVIRDGNGNPMQDDDVPDWLDDVVSVQHSAGASSSEINSWAYWRDNDYAGDDMLIPGGYSQIFQQVSDDIDIQLNRPVIGVKINPSAASLRMANGDTLEFDAVILTVPLGVLKSGAIQFEPPLPKAKRGAIDRLGMGTLDKLYLRYDTVFWDKNASWLITPDTGLPAGQFNQWLNLYPYMGEPIVVAFNGAQPALDLSTLPDSELVKMAQRVLASAFP